MLYFRCPTCKTILANKQVPYEEGFNRICKNDKIPKQEKDKLKKKLLDELEIINICCRQRVLGYVDLVRLIK